MHFPETSIENLRGFGYTEDGARFLYLVATHSGYFSARQYLAFTGAKSGEKSVLAHLDYRYLETETEKVDYFCRKLSISRTILPSKRYKGAIREKTTDRYFVDKFPSFFAAESSSSPVVTFSFVDPGLLSLASFETHLFAYSNLFSAVPQVNFVYIATSPRHFAAARELFLAVAPQTKDPDPGVEGLRYFHYRHMWETKQYGRLSVDQIEFLNVAKKRFDSTLTEIRYQQWLHGQITAGAVSEEFRRLAPPREVSFRTELVDGQTALFEPGIRAKNRETGDQEVTDRLQETFGPDFKAPFGRETQQAEEK